MRLGEPARDRLTGQVHDGIHAVEQVRGGIAWFPTAFIGSGGIAAHQPDHPVPTGGQERGQRGADQAGRPGHRDDEPARTRLRGVAVRGQVVGQLPVPVGEGGAQRRTGHRGVHLVVDAGALVAGVAEPVGVSPPADDPRRQRHQPVRGQRVDELVRRVVAGRIVPGDPAQPGGQAEDRDAVGQRRRLGHHPHRLPRRDQAAHRAGTGVPGEDLLEGMVDDAGVFDAHGCTS